MTLAANVNLEGLLAERPAPGVPGRFFYATDTGATYSDDGAAWVAITPSGTSQTANKVFAGPATGTAAAPTFRSLVTADLPALVLASTSGAPSDTPVAGTVRFDATAKNLYVYTGSAWVAVALA